jgi:hypothetical protein
LCTAKKPSQEHAKTIADWGPYNVSLKDMSFINPWAKELECQVAASWEKISLSDMCHYGATGSTFENNMQDAIFDGTPTSFQRRCCRLRYITNVFNDNIVQADVCAKNWDKYALMEKGMEKGRDGKKKATMLKATMLMCVNVINNDQYLSTAVSYGVSKKNAGAKNTGAGNKNNSDSSGTGAGARNENTSDSLVADSYAGNDQYHSAPAHRGQRKQ